MRRLWTFPIVLTAACFADAPGTTGGTETGGTSGSESASGVTATETSPTTTATSTTDSTVGSESSAEGSGTTEMGTDTAVDTTGGELGPRIIKSIPQDGDPAAPLDPYFMLFFDRVVSPNDAVGKLFVSQEGGTPAPVSPQPCPPDNDPTCIAALFPMSFQDPVTKRLPSGTEHEVVVKADFPDPAGLTNTMDQTVSFTTFAYDANWYDDSMALASYVGGIVYEPTVEALFLVGVNGQDTIVRRVPIPGGVAQPASTVAMPTYTGGGPYAFGLYTSMGELWVPMSYAGDVRRFNNLAAADFQMTELILGPPTLMAPYDTLDEVWSIARSGTRMFMSFGNFFGGENRYGIVEYTNGTWSIFNSGVNLWNMNDCVIATGTVDSTPLLFALGDAKVFKFRMSDNSLLGEYPVPEGADGWGNSLVLDGGGRLWLGNHDGLWVMDAKNSQLPVITKRTGISAGRFALRPEGNTTHVYFVEYQGPAKIGHLTITF